MDPNLIDYCIDLVQNDAIPQARINEGIALALGWTSYEHPDRPAENLWLDPGGLVTDLPEFTTSLIDAMSVLPNGTKLDMVLRADGTGYACVWTKHGCRSTSQDTLTKALLIVALKARILQEV